MTEPSLPQRLQHLVAQIQDLDPAERERARDLVQSVLALHGAGLAQLLALIRQEGDIGTQIAQRVAQDPLVRNLLLLHGLHPDDLETRVCQALDQVRALLHSQGAEVALVAVADDAVRLRLHRQDAGYPASLQTLKAAIEEAIAAASPDVRLIEFVATDEPGSRVPSRFSLPLVAPHAGIDRPIVAAPRFLDEAQDLP